MFDFTRITQFCLGYRLSKHKFTVCSKNWGNSPLGPPGCAYGKGSEYFVFCTETNITIELGYCTDYKTYNKDIRNDFLRISEND